VKPLFRFEYTSPSLSSYVFCSDKLSHYKVKVFCNAKPYTRAHGLKATGTSVCSALGLAKK
jgi:hypothetical protein